MCININGICSVNKVNSRELQPFTHFIIVTCKFTVKSLSVSAKSLRLNTVEKLHDIITKQ